MIWEIVGTYMFNTLLTRGVEWMKLIPLPHLMHDNVTSTLPEPGIGSHLTVDVIMWLMKFSILLGPRLIA